MIRIKLRDPALIRNIQGKYNSTPFPVKDCGSMKKTRVLKINPIKA